MRQPPTMEAGDPSHVCILNKALYGLKQAPRAWWVKLTAALEQLQLARSSADQALWTGRVAGHTGLVHWVDDLLLVGSSDTALTQLKRSLLARFKGRDLGVPDSFLGMQIERTPDTLKLSLPSYIDSVLVKYNLASAKSREIPISPGADTSARRPDEPAFADPCLYRGAVGALLYLACTCRPDLAFAVSTLAKANHDPGQRHWQLLQGVLRYLQGTRELGLVYRSGSPTLIGYSDADYAGDTLTRKSRSGFVFRFAGAAICWHSRQQPIVATSTAESEYTAAFRTWLTFPPSHWTAPPPTGCGPCLAWASFLACSHLPY